MERKGGNWERFRDEILVALKVAEVKFSTQSCYFTEDEALAKKSLELADQYSSVTSTRRLKFND